MVGPRNCIGKTWVNPALFVVIEADYLKYRLAWAEMKLVLAKVLWNFDLELSEKMMEGDWSDQKVYLLNQKMPMYVKMMPRV